VARTEDVYRLPEGLPVPLDDGACAHLPGAAVPEVRLPSTAGGAVSLREKSNRGWAVVFVYPRTGRPEQEVPAGWNAIPGARGCTPQACAIRERHADFVAAGASVFGLSTQEPAYQLEVATRLHLPYPLLSDAQLGFSGPLRLPTFAFGGESFLRRCTLFLRDGRVAQVQYPVFPSDKSAAWALAWLAEQPARPR
jgi:peroxiredoxin